MSSPAIDKVEAAKRAFKSMARYDAEAARSLLSAVRDVVLDRGAVSEPEQALMEYLDRAVSEQDRRRKTHVPVRVAVLVDDAGNWNAAGWPGGGEDAEEMNADVWMEDTPGGGYYHNVWLEAWVPMPVERRVNAKVVANEL